MRFASGEKEMKSPKGWQVRQAPVLLYESKHRAITKGWTPKGPLYAHDTSTALDSPREFGHGKAYGKAWAAIEGQNQSHRLKRIKKEAALAVGQTPRGSRLHTYHSLIQRWGPFDRQ